jgi:TolB-like protein/tetratricopeptide (TPR) repeat protein
MSKPSFFAELKRRNVLRAGVLYAGAVWAFGQGLSQFSPAIGLPDWATRWFLIAAAIGFPFWIAFAWFYEFTPSGLRRESEIDPADSVAHSTGRKLDKWIIGVLAVAVVLLVTNTLLWHKGTAPDAGAVAARAPAKSIAVLPFENLSTDKDNAYFADGIQDEILTGLAKIGDLKVISRTSTQRYASKPDNILDIARQLGVANILEGSVQRIGDRVRVNVQLIAAASDSHLWAETYDRTLDDVFAVQSEVAQKIADSLQARLTHDEHVTLSTRPTTNPAAYDAYLRGLALDARGFELATARKAAMEYAEAVRLDPAFALAWAKLAEGASYLYFNGVDPETWTADYVKHAADTAFRLQPELVEAQLAQGYYRYRVLRDFSGAAQAFAAVLQKSPNNHKALQYLGLAERRQGKWEQALGHLEQAAERDPRNPGLMTLIGGETLANMRRYEEDRAWLDRALAIAPDSSLAMFYKAFSYLLQGRMEDAANLLDPIPQTGEDPQIAWVRSILRLHQRRYAAAIAELQPLLAQPSDTLNGWGPQLAISLGYAQRWHGDTAQARATFQHLITEIGPQGASRVDDSSLPIVLAQAYAGLDEDKLALAQAQHAVDLYHSDRIYGPQADWVLAQVQAMAGDHAAAIAGLKQSLQVPAGVTQAQLRLDPMWDPLRKDPAFQKLIANGEPAQGRSTP